MEQYFSLLRTPEFRFWYAQQTEKAKVQIVDRLYRIQVEGYFGDHKCLSMTPKGVWELRWKNGRRLYFAYRPEKQILLLLGGNKNGQDKDIRQAKSLLEKYL